MYKKHGLAHIYLIRRRHKLN